MTSNRRKGKEIPRLLLSAFTHTGTSDTFPLPPTPSLISPRGIIDSHGDTAHLKRAVVLSPPTAAIISSLPSLQPEPSVLAVLTPFALNATQVPTTASPALTTVYDGTTFVAAEAEGENKDQTQVENSVKNLHWAVQHGRVVDLDIDGGIIAIDGPAYDSLINLLTNAVRSDTNANRAPIVLTSVLPPPLGSLMPVVTMMNDPIYTTYLQRASSLSLFENVHVKLLPPAWVTESQTESQQRESRNLLKLFIVPVLEAFGFDRIIFGSSPASASGSPALAEIWYKLVLESFRELAVSQDEMDKIFCKNAERIYHSGQ